MKQNNGEKRLDGSKTNTSLNRKTHSRREEKDRSVLTKHQPPRPKEGSSKRRQEGLKEKDVKQLLLELEKKQKEIHRRQEELEEVESQLKEEIDQLRQENQLLSAHQAEGERFRSEMAVQCEQARAQAELLKGKLHSREAQLQDYRGIYEKLKCATEERDRFELSCKQFQAKLLAKGAEQLKAREQFQRSALKFHQLEEAKRQVKLLEQGREQDQMRIVSLEKELQKSKKQVEAKARVEQLLKGEMLRLREEANRKDSDLQAKSALVKELRAEAKTKGQPGKQQLARKDRLLQKLEQKVRNLIEQNDKLSKLNLTVLRQKQEISKLKQNQSNFSASMESLDKQVDGSKSYIDMLKFKAKTDKEEIARLRAELEVAKRQGEHLQCQRSQQQLVNRLAAAEAQLGQSGIESSRLLSQNQRIRLDLAQTLKQASRLKAELQQKSVGLGTVQQRELAPPYFVRMPGRETAVLAEMPARELLRGMIVFNKLQQIQPVRKTDTTFLCLDQSVELYDVIDLKQRVLLKKGELGFGSPSEHIRLYCLDRLGITKWREHDLGDRKVHSYKEDQARRQHLPSSESISDQEQELIIYQMVGEEESPLPRLGRPKPHPPAEPEQIQELDEHALSRVQSALKLQVEYGAADATQPQAGIAGTGQLEMEKQRQINAQAESFVNQGQDQSQQIKEMNANRQGDLQGLEGSEALAQDRDDKSSQPVFPQELKNSAQEQSFPSPNQQQNYEGEQFEPQSEHPEFKGGDFFMTERVPGGLLGEQVQVSEQQESLQYLDDQINDIRKQVRQITQLQPQLSLTDSGVLKYSKDTFANQSLNFDLAESNLRRKPPALTLTEVEEEESQQNSPQRQPPGDEVEGSINSLQVEINELKLTNLGKVQPEESLLPTRLEYLKQEQNQFLLEPSNSQGTSPVIAADKYSSEHKQAIRPYQPKQDKEESAKEEPQGGVEELLTEDDLLALSGLGESRREDQGYHVIKWVELGGEQRLKIIGLEGQNILDYFCFLCLTQLDSPSLRKYLGQSDLHMLQKVNDLDDLIEAVAGENLLFRFMEVARRRQPSLEQSLGEVEQLLADFFGEELSWSDGSVRVPNFQIVEQDEGISLRVLSQY